VIIDTRARVIGLELRGGALRIELVPTGRYIDNGYRLVYRFERFALEVDDTEQNRHDFAIGTELDLRLDAIGAQPGGGS